MNLEVGMRVRLRWVVRHPAGKWWIRDHEVTIDRVAEEDYGFRYGDDVGGTVEKKDIVWAEPVEVVS